MIRKTLLSAVLLLACAWSLSGGQDPVLDRGYNADGLYDFHDIDDINLLNGNLQMTVPLGQTYKTNGSLQYRFALHYNANFWEFQDFSASGGTRIHLHDYSAIANPHLPNDSTDPLPTTAGQESYISPEFNAGVGWMLTLGELPSYLLYVSPDGARHGFHASLHGDPPIGFDYRHAQYLYTRDGTYLRMKRIPAPDNSERYREIQSPDGVRKRFKCVANCSANIGHTWLLDQIADPLGSVLWVSRIPATRPTFGTWIWTFHEAVRTNDPPAGSGADAYYADHDNPGDTLVQVRQHEIDFHVINLAYMDVMKVRLAGPNGYSIYELSYVPNADIYRTHAHSWAGFGLFNPFNNRGKVDVMLLEKVKLPANAGEWKFEYYLETQPAADDDPYDLADPLYTRTWGSVTYSTAWYSGLLHKVTLPTKGAISYRWTRRGIPQRTCDMPGMGERRSYGMPSVGKRQVWRADNTKDGKPWLYFGRGYWNNVECGAPREYLSTIVDPLGNTTVSFFSIYIGRYPDGYWDQREFGSPGSKFDVAGSGSAVKFIESQVYSCTHENFFAVEPPVLADRLKRIVPRVAAPNAPTCGNPVRSEYVRYRKSTFDCDGVSVTGCTAVNRLPEGTRTVYHDDNDSFSDTEYSDFDGLGHFRNTVLSGGGGFGAATREEFTFFNPGMSENVLPTGPAWLLGTYTERREKQGSQKARRYMSFDPITGFQLAERRLKNGATSTGGDPAMSVNDVLLLFTRSRSSVTPTVAAVEEKVYGGDRQTLGTTDTQMFSANGNTPAYSVLTRAQYGTTNYAEYRNGALTFLKTKDDTIDANTGLVTSSVSSAGARTTYTYDNYGRMTRVIPELDPLGGSNYLREASIGYLYTTATGESDGQRAQVLVSRPADCTTNCVSQARTYFDHLGRPALKERRMAGASRWGRVRTIYNVLGWVESVSTAHEGSAAIGWVTRSAFDPFGRPGEIRAPDNAKTKITYGGERTVNREVENVKGPNGHHSIRTYEEYDRFGRLVGVSDHSDPGSSTSVPATYVYDVAGRLTQVTLSSAAAGQNQTRSFTYDNRGFRTSETHPEVGRTVRFGDIDARGHAWREYIADGDALNLRYEFDAAERLTKITQETTGRALKELAYFDTNTDDCGTNAGLAIGKVKSAVRHNWVPDPNLTAAKNDYTVAETFLYRGVEGRMSHRTTTMTRPNNGGELGFKQGFRYNSLGLLSETEYPMCAACGGTGPERTVANTFAFGQLTSVSGYASVDYHINGLVSQITHTTPGVGGAGVRDIRGRDLYSMERPASIYTRNVIGGDWNPQGRLEYSYDGGGNVDGVTDPANAEPAREVYRFDAANRLVRAVVGGQTQTYGYDRFGNITSINGASVGVAWNTNRLTAGTYNDGAGTLRNLDGYTYDYDQLHMMRHAYGSGLGKIFLYTPNDQRIATLDYKATDANGLPTVRETWTIRGDRDQVLRVFEKLGTWTWKKDYIYRGTELLASTGVEGERRYHLDHLGTPRLITDGSGARVSSHTYFPFGQEINNPDVDSEVMKFTGHERDNNNATPGARNGDLDYMRARYYTPQYGRFLSVDPARKSMRPAVPQSWNRYSYVINNPVRYTDPYGLDWFKLNGKWTHLEGIEVMYVERVNMKGKVTSSQTVHGVKFGVVFNGTGLTMLREDGTKRTIPAISGRVSGFGEIHPGQQGRADVGPIPEGRYTFSPWDIQTISNRDKVLGQVGRGAWPGGTYAWGTQRVFLTPAEGTNTYGRSGFSIHGGEVPGSAGCIDLCDMVNSFFNEVPRDVDPILVDVDYSAARKPSQ